MHLTASSFFLLISVALAFFATALRVRRSHRIEKRVLNLAGRIFGSTTIELNWVLYGWKFFLEIRGIFGNRRVRVLVYDDGIVDSEWVSITLMQFSSRSELVVTRIVDTLTPENPTIREIFAKIRNTKGFCKFSSSSTNSIYSRSENEIYIERELGSELLSDLIVLDVETLVQLAQLGI